MKENHPWLHIVFKLAQCVCSEAAWMSNERERARVRHLISQGFPSVHSANKLSGRDQWSSGRRQASSKPFSIHLLCNAHDTVGLHVAYMPCLYLAYHNTNSKQFSYKYNLRGLTRPPPDTAALTFMRGFADFQWKVAVSQPSQRHFGL